MVSAGFPKSLLTLLRCPQDGECLALDPTSHETHEFVVKGMLTCSKCGRLFPIVDGIVRMLDMDDANPEDRHEMALRDEESQAISLEQEEAFSTSTRVEIASTLAALRLNSRCTMLEFACGKGRFTIPLSQRCRAVLAVDYSLRSLEFLVRRPRLGINVGLVNADITRLGLAPRCFNRALATTPLDTREQRLAMHRIASDALQDDGTYVFSTEHYDLRSRLLGLPRALRYTPNGILFFRLTRLEVEREAGSYFEAVRSRPISLSLPFISRRPGRLLDLLSRIAERVPGVKELGDLLLVRAERPIRPVEEGQTTKGSRLFRYAYRKLSSGSKRHQLET